MNFFGKRLEGFAKALVGLTAIFLVSCGLCGLSVGLKFADGFAIVIAILSGLAILLSSLGILFVVIVWPISAAYNRYSRRSKNNLQKLFDTRRDKGEKDTQ